MVKGITEYTIIYVLKENPVEFKMLCDKLAPETSTTLVDHNSCRSLTGLEYRMQKFTDIHIITALRFKSIIPEQLNFSTNCSSPR